LWYFGYFCGMKKNVIKKEATSENIKLPSFVVKLLRENKDKTGIPITTFATSAIMDKLKSEKKHIKKDNWYVNS
jgi:hypothetical protein